ncbi:pumilio homolog 3-like [Rhopilema esculentum]|uniref:pumilio homolog 3-like n=1 Tax=Rhopilema esculentum TaxID=499914 RepID=UPI0031D862F7
MKRRTDRKGQGSTGKKPRKSGDLKKREDGPKKFKPKSTKPKSSFKKKKDQKSTPGKDNAKKSAVQEVSKRKRKLDDENGNEGSASKKSKNVPKQPLTKKEKKAKRREQKDSAGIISPLMEMYEKLRSKKLSKSQKQDVINEVLTIIKGKESNVLYKHDCVRVLEFCVKFGNDSQRENIYEIYKEHNVELLKSKYSKFLVKKLIKYGKKNQRSLVIKALYGNVKKLVRQKEASGVLEFIYHQFADSGERSSLIEEFYGPQYAVFKAAIGRKLEDIFDKEPDKKPLILRHLKDSLMPLAAKTAITLTIVHKPLLEFFTFAEDQMRAEMIEALREVIVQMVHTLDGSRVAMNCIWYGTKKDRKLIIKSFKTFVSKICMEEYGYLVLLALFDVVDDTVAMRKSILSEIIPKFPELIQNQYGRKVILYLLSPRNKNYFAPKSIQLLETGDGNPTSKKNAATRQEELRGGILDKLFTYMNENVDSFINDKSDCQILLAALEHSLESVESLEVMTSIAKLASEPLDQEAGEENHPAIHACAHWVIKRIIQQDKLRQERGEKNLFCKVLLDTVPENEYGKWVQYNRGAFVVASLLESGVEEVQMRVKKALQKVSDTLQPGKSKGMDVVIKLLGL